MRNVLALLAVILLSGCVITPPVPVATGPEADYQRAAVYAKDKKYPQAIAAYLKIADDSPPSPQAGDALFEAAYLHAFYENPGRDYALALAWFDEFLKRFPNHAKAREAKNWRSVLKTIVDMKTENERLNKSIDELNKLDIRHEEMRREK